jgi:S1-C subfamily serine protease
MKRHHKIVLGSFSTVIVIFMVVMGILMNGMIVKQTIENNQLKEKIKQIEMETDGKINELAVSMINTKQSFKNDFEILNFEMSKEIDLLKSENYDDFSGIIEESMKSIFTIRTLTNQGTGFTISNKGYLVTNMHVLTNPEGELSKVIQAVSIDNKIYSAKYIGGILDLDLALLKINPPASNLEIENSDSIEIGEKVIAIGNPQGFQFSVTDGIVSAKNRIGLNGIEGYIQTNAELNPGNSGGPLINKKGKVIGMNNFKLVESEGLGFALESNYIREGVNQISQEILNVTLI